LIGKIIKTAASGKRIEITGATFATYNDAGQMHGPRIYPGDGDMIICHNGIPVLDIGIVAGNVVSIQSLSGYKLDVSDHPNYDWVNNNFVTQEWVESFVNSQGFIKGTNGASGFADASNTLVISNGLVESIL
jgi:hypothetical protein